MRKELPLWDHRKAWRDICVEFTHNSVKPALDIAHLHEMKWNLCFNFNSPRFGRDCHQAEDKNTCFPARCGSLYPPHWPQSAPITSSLPPSFLLQFLSFSFCYLFSWASFGQRTGGRWIDGFTSLPQDPGFLSSMMDQKQESEGIHRPKDIRGAGKLGRLTLVSKGALLWGWGFGKSNEKNGKSFFPCAVCIYVTGIAATLKQFCTVVVSIYHQL